MEAIGFKGGFAQQQPEMLTVPVPQLGEGEVLIRMHAVGLSSPGRHGWSAPADEPTVLGQSGAGVITEVGPGVTAYAVGDAVLFSNPAMAKGGAWAEYAAVPAGRLIPKPEGLSFAEAAALPGAAEVAQAALDLLDAGRGRSVLIVDGASPVGTLAIQLAAQRQCWVLVGARPRHHNFLRTLGAQFVFSTEDPRWIQRIREFVMQGVHGALVAGSDPACIAAVRDGGGFVTTDAAGVAGEREIQIHQLADDFTATDHLASVAADIAAKRLRAVVDRVFPWTQALEALQRAQSGTIRGTTVLTIHE